MMGISLWGLLATSVTELASWSSTPQLVAQILFDSEGLGQTDLLSLDQKGPEIRSIRGKEISMIFQEPMVAFSPMYTIGNQINEATRLHITKDKKKSKESLDGKQSLLLLGADLVYGADQSSCVGVLGICPEKGGG